MNKRMWSTVDLDKFRGNIRALKQRLSRCQIAEGSVSPDRLLNRSTQGELNILAVVKADAYGHGAKEISKAAKEEGVQVLGVASVGEAYELKSVGLPILILFPFAASDIPTIVAERFMPTVPDHGFAEELDREAKRRNRKVKIHVHIDTGMMTAGVRWEDGVEFIDKLLTHKNLELDGIFTHFAESENQKNGFTGLQIERFNEVLVGLDKRGIHIPMVHAASTEAIINFRNAYFNTVRPGIMLYGLCSALGNGKRIEIEPILSLQTRVCRVRQVPNGTPIGYHGTYVTEREQRIATLSVGYGDGYPRGLSNKGEVIIRGKSAAIVGTVCMDLTMVDVTDIPGVEEGDEATLIGRDGECEITADDIARLVGTINYEIVTRISARVERIHIGKSMNTV
jgi:alanine racemase